MSPAAKSPCCRLADSGPTRRAGVLVTGIGVVAPNGIGKESFWESTLGNRCFVAPVERFDTRSYSCRVAGQVDGFRARDFLSQKIVKQTDRCTHMALACCQQATADAGLDLAGESPEEMGMCFANVFGGMEFAERELYTQSFVGPERVSAYQSIAWFFAATQGQWSIAAGIKGFGKSIVADRVGGQQALLLAALAMRQGQASVIYAGGFEAPLVPYVFRIHEGTRLLSASTSRPDQAYRPFDAERSGLVLAEGSAVLLLEEASRALARGAPIYAELAGGSITFGEKGQDDRDDPLVRCLEAAVADAGLSPSQVDHVVAEGLALREADGREARAIDRVFGRHATTVSVPKARTGHALAAAGALDAAWAALMLSRDTLLDPVNLERLDVGVELKLSHRGRGPAGLGAILCCGRGFGGVNTAIVLRRFDPGATP